MPSYRHHELGDLYVQIKVKFPESIDPAVIPMLEQALPARNGMPKLPKKTHIDEVTLEEPNDRQKRSAASNGDEMDEDDEDGRGPGVACAQRMFFHPLQSIWLMMYRISVMLAF
jgi:DnaJ family protein A protein 2